MQSAMRNVNADPDKWVRIISAADQETIKAAIPSLDCDDPQYYWIFKNMDFERWRSVSSQALWLSGPPECNLHQVASHLVDIARNKMPNNQHYVLYCISLTANMQSSSTKVLASVFFQQLIRHVPAHQKDAVVTLFFRTLLDSIPHADNEKVLFGPEYEFPNRIIQNTIDLSSDKAILDTLKTVLELVQLDIQELTIIIHGLDQVPDNQTKDFIGNIRAFL
jgi:hypothetical protein